MPARTFSLQLSLFNVFLFLGMGVQLPFLPLWLQYKGLAAGEIGIVIAAMTAIRVVAAPVLPNASPKEISGAPSKAKPVATVNSGLDVAKAATVAAIMSGDIRAALANPKVPLTKSSPPPPAQANPSNKAK